MTKTKKNCSSNTQKVVRNTEQSTDANNYKKLLFQAIIVAIIPAITSIYIACNGNLVDKEIADKNTSSDERISERSIETDILLSEKSLSDGDYKFILNLMIDNVGITDAELFFNTNIQRLIDQYYLVDQERADILKESFDIFVLENERYWVNKTQNFHRYAADCFSEKNELRHTGVTKMLDNFDVRNMQSCIVSMLDIVNMAEKGLMLNSAHKVYGYTNFAAFLGQYTSFEVYKQYDDPENNLHKLVSILYYNGDSQVKSLLDNFLLFGYISVEYLS